MKTNSKCTVRRLSVFVFGLVLCMQVRLYAAKVELIRIEGAIGPATAGYISRAVEKADSEGDQCLIVEIDTPGGLLDSTKTIVQKFYTSRVPVVVYVSPPGATATSAGCFITLAADVAAMAPNTSIGAAHPVSIGEGEGKSNSVMKQKLENFAASYIETIAEKRKRNVEWAKSAVRESASITAEKALELKVVEIIAKDLPDLLQKLNGREIDGRKLETANAQIIRLPMNARETVFQSLWRPEIMLLLIMIAMYGIIGELTNPGAILPGVAGVIAFVLALYMAAILPVTVAGVALLILAVALFIVDIYAPTHGVLTGGGIIAFFLGGLMLFDRSEPAFRMSMKFVVPATLVTAAFFLFVVGKGVRAQFLPTKAGPETMLGKITTALTPINQKGGKIFVEGEYWNAVSDGNIEKGRQIEIISLQGLVLKVKEKT